MQSRLNPTSDRECVEFSDQNREKEHEKEFSEKRDDFESGSQRSNVTFDITNEPVLDQRDTATGTKFLGETGTVTSHMTTPHGKITATTTETPNRKTTTVTEHIQKSGVFGQGDPNKTF